MSKFLVLLCLLPLFMWGEELTVISFDLRNWQANQSISDLRMENNYLGGKCSGNDPQLYSPLFEIRANNRQVVEIKMKSDKDGLAQLFWSGTLEEPYGGFRPQKCNDFYVKGDNNFHIYRIFPFWEGEGKIIHLRLDPPDGATFYVEYICVKELKPLSQGNWVVLGGLEVGKVGVDSIQFKVKADESAILLPLTPFEGSKFPFLSFCLKLKTAKKEHYGEIVYQEGNERRSFAFDLIADAKPHYYNIFPGWLGKVSSAALILRHCEGEGELSELGVGVEPKGEELQITHFGIDGIARAKKPFTLLLQVKNVGAPLRGVVVELRLPKDVKLLQGSPSMKIDDIHFGESKFIQWTAISDKAGDFKAFVKLTTGKLSWEFFSYLKIREPLSLPPSPYPPEPETAKTDWEVGVYYFPGWPSASNWLPVKNWGRKPLLGYYKEGNPEVIDWQIKWCLEHGITFFIFDWYWVQGKRMLEHALHDAFLKSRYGERMKFSLLWANHNPPKTSSLADLLNLTRFCIDRYFRLPNYLRIDDKPTLFIFTPRQLTDDMGVEGVKEAFQQMRELCKQEGLKGLFIIGCMHDSDWDLRVMKEEGYDAVTGYNYPWAGAGSDDKRVPYDEMLRGYSRIWKGIVDKGYDYIVPTTPGWDPRPWHGPNTLVRINPTPASFQKMLRLAKEFVEKNGLRKMIIIEAWNEWGEGSYIEPSREWGFAYLDAIRDVFVGKGEHEDIVPQDIGLPLIEAEFPPSRDSWEFEEDLEGWSAMMGISEFRVEGGCLVLRTSTNDPAINLPPVHLEAKKYKKIKIRMKVDKGSVGQVFWATSVFPISEFTSQRFQLIADNEFHTYELDLSSNPAWQDTITSIRFDPTDSADATVVIDYMRIE